MGVKHLNKIIKKYANEENQCIVEKKLSSYKNKIIVIDISLFLYKFYSMQGHLFTGLFHQIELFLKNSIIPWYVFDGAYDDLKTKEMKQRKQIHKKNKEKCEKLKKDDPDNKKEIFKYENRSFEITDDIVQWCKCMFDNYGIPYIQAKGETDKLCAQLVSQGYAHACLSDDTDMFPYGCPVVLRDIKSKGTVMEYRLNNIIPSLGLDDYQQFASFCVLLGNDYCDNIRSVGPASALKLIKRYKTIDAIVNVLQKKIDTLDSKIYNKVLSIYTVSKPLKKIKIPTIKKVDLNQAIIWSIKQIKPNRKEKVITRLEKML